MSDSRLVIVAGDVLDPGSMSAAINGADVVLSALGRHGNQPTTMSSTGVANIVAAMDRVGVKRFGGISATPVTPPEEVSVRERRVLFPLLRRFFGESYADMELMEQVLRGATSTGPWSGHLGSPTARRADTIAPRSDGLSRGPGRSRGPTWRRRYSTWRPIPTRAGRPWPSPPDRYFLKRAIVRPTSREITSATYIIPPTCSTMTTDRPGVRQDRPDVGETGRGQCGEGQEEQLEPGPSLLGVGVGVERVRLPDLDHRIEVGKTPGDDGERRARGIELVLGHPVVVEHVTEQAVGRVEVEEGVHARRPEDDRGVVRDEALDDGQDGVGQAEDDRHPRQRRPATDGPHGEEEHDDAEEARDRPTEALPLADRRDLEEG